MAQKKNKTPEEMIEELASAGAKAGAEEHVKNSFFSYFKKHQTKLGIGDRLEALYQWLVNGKFQGKDKAVLIGALIYFINPLDFIPDLTPFVGLIDDVGILTLAYRYLQNRALEESEPPKK